MKIRLSLKILFKNCFSLVLNLISFLSNKLIKTAFFHDFTLHPILYHTHPAFSIGCLKRFLSISIIVNIDKPLLSTYTRAF